MKPIGVDPAIKRALWRLALNGNPHWVRYYSGKDKPPGTNDGQCSEGHVDSSGKDRTQSAGKPYWYTPRQVDRDRRGFGFWSRSEAGAYRFACHDIEVRAPGPDGKYRKVERPARWQRWLCLQHALRVYYAWRAMARRNSRIVAVLLIETSGPGNYHVWALFAEPLTRAEHDKLLARHRRLASTGKATRRGGWLPEFQDKDTGRAKQGKGDQFRAPWSWKKGGRSEALRVFIPDRERLIRLGEEAKPSALQSTARQPTPATSFRPGDVQYLTEWAVNRYPIRRGGRNDIQARLILSLLNRGVQLEVIKLVGAEWLARFKPSPDSKDFYDLDLGPAITRFDRCVDRTVGRQADGSLGEGECDPDEYLRRARSVRLSPLQKRFLRNPHACPGVLSSPENWGKDKTPRKMRFTRVERLVLESLLVMCRVELDKGDRQAVKFTLEQLIEVLRVRRKKPTFTIQDLSSDYLPRFVTRRDAKKPAASVLELLVRIEKGQAATARPSVYELTPLMWSLLDQTLGQARPGPPSPGPEAQSIAAGPETVPPARAAGAASPSDLISQPEEHHPRDDACGVAYTRTKAKITAGLGAETAAGLDDLPEDADPARGVLPVPDDNPL
jgi:hypothetical protein